MAVEPGEARGVSQCMDMWCWASQAVAGDFFQFERRRLPCRPGSSQTVAEAPNPTQTETENTGTGSG